LAELPTRIYLHSLYIGSLSSARLIRSQIVDRLSFVALNVGRLAAVIVYCVLPRALHDGQNSNAMQGQRNSDPGGF
jgi:hypothetical protein